MQLDTPERGFSFMQDGPLDMRMSSDGPTAADVVNLLPERELTAIIATLGEEKRARAIARAIAAQRAEAPIERGPGSLPPSSPAWSAGNMTIPSTPRPAPSRRFASI